MDLIVWSLIGPHYQLISDRTAVCILVKVNEHFFLNLTTESTVCDVEKPKPTIIPVFPLRYAKLVF